VWCTACDARHPWEGSLSDGPACRPAVTHRCAPTSCGSAKCIPHGDIFAAGAGGPVRVDRHVPRGLSAAGFVQQASAHGARTLELNLERSRGSHWFDETRLGPASQLVPTWVDEVLGG